MHKSVCMHSCMHVDRYVGRQTCMIVYACMYESTYKCMYAHMYVCAGMYVHIDETVNMYAYCYVR